MTFVSLKGKPTLLIYVFESMSLEETKENTYPNNNNNNDYLWGDRTRNDFIIINNNIIIIILSSSSVSFSLLVFSRLYLMNMLSLFILYYEEIRKSQSHVIIFGTDFFATHLRRCNKYI